MTQDKCTVLCTDCMCEYNSGGGYYSVCNNPNRPGIYSGIDRIYMNSCSKRQPPRKEKKGKDNGNSKSAE